MNETIQTILSRKSIRAYTDEPVSDEDIATIVSCGLQAPTGMNRQPWHVTVVQNRALLDRISAKNQEIMAASPDESTRKKAAVKNFDNFRSAPMAIIISGTNRETYTIADCANVTENMALAAHALGLGSCYIASFALSLNQPDGSALKTELGIPDEYMPLFALCLGHAAEDPAPRKRNPDVVNYVK